MANKLIKLAKSSKNKSTIIKNVAETKKISSVDERKLKAKQKVDELLQDIELVKDKKISEDKFELDVEKSNKNIDWLQEQIALLSEMNEKLKNDLAIAKEDYTKIFNDMQKFKNGLGDDNNFAKIKIIELFDELQNNHIKLGTDPRTGIGNFRIYCPGFLNRMITFFPFLSEIKRY